MKTISTNRILIMAAAGALAGFATFLLLDPSLQAQDAANHSGSLADLQEGLSQALSHVLLLGGVLGATIGGALIFVEEAATKRIGRILGRVFLGAVAGAVCGSIGGICGQILFSLLLVPLAVMGQAGMPVLIVARTAGWSLVGAGAGICPGAIARSQKRIRQGCVGGAIGGAAGGLFFDAIAAATQGGSVSRCVGFTLIGCAVGALVGIIEEAGKQHWLTMLSGAREGRATILAKPATTLGRSEMADVPLFGDTTVQPAHAIVLLNDNVVSLRADASPVFINNQPAAMGRLSDGDIITIGRHRIRFNSRVATTPLPVPTAERGFQFPAGAPLSAMPSIPGAPISAMSAVTIVAGPHMGSVFPLFDGAIAGRDPRCDIALVNDTQASRQHARFLSDGVSWRVEDGGSTNGTYVNGQRTTLCVLQAGDQIAIGGSVLQIG